MRRWFVLLVVVGTLLLTSHPATAKRKRCDSVRFTRALDPVQDLVTDLWDAGPTGKAKNMLSIFVRSLKKCPRTLASEIKSASSLARRVNLFRGLEGQRATFNPLLDDAAAIYDARVEAEIDYIEDLLRDIRLAGNDTTKGEALIVDARGRLASARFEGDVWVELDWLSSAMGRAQRVKQVTRVSKPPKKCKGRRLKSGEFCTATLSGNVTKFNIGEATIRTTLAGDIVRILITFESCNGDGGDQRIVTFSVRPPFLGTVVQGSGQSSLGSYRRGDGGFFSPWRTGSSITITDVDVNQGYIVGEFQFTTTNVATDNAHFRITGAKTVLN